jgi:RNA polymerase sigma-70 factor (ECF subfamily)
MTTHWSLVGDFSLQQVAPDRAEAALARLCRDYWPPLYRFLRGRGYSSADAQDLTQGFFAYLLEKKQFPIADQSKGRFRTFLLTLLKRYVKTTNAYNSRQKRGGGGPMICFDEGKLIELDQRCQELAINAPLDEERTFEWNWAAALVGRAMQALAEEYSSGVKAQIFAELRPFLTGGVGLPTHETVSKNLGIPLETVRSHLCRLRGRYRAHLRAEVRRTVGQERDIDDELRYLCRVLIASA